MWRFANQPRRPLNHEQLSVVALATPVLAGMLADALERGGGGKGSGVEHAEYGRKQERTIGGAHATEPPLLDKADAAIADAFLHSPSGTDVEWGEFVAEGRWALLQRLLEKPLRLMVSGEGGTGKTHVVVNIILGGAFRFFLREFYTERLLAYTNRAAGLLGAGADTMCGFAGIQPDKRGRDGHNVPNWGRVTKGLIGAGALPGENSKMEKKMLETGLIVLDELSHVDAPAYDKANERVTKFRPGPAGQPLDRKLVPFGMMPIVIQMGDPAQLTMPNAHPVFKYMRLFQLMRPPKHSPRTLSELVTGERTRSGSDATFAERYRLLNDISQGAALPRHAPRPGDDVDAPPAVMPIEMLDARGENDERVYPIDTRAEKLSEEARAAFEAYIRGSQDVVHLPHAQRFKDDDGAPLLGEDGTELPVRELGTVNPHGDLPKLLRLMREGTLVARGEGIPKALFNRVLGKHRETPQVLKTPGSFPSDATTTIAHQWEFLAPLNMAAARARARDEGKMMYVVAAHDDEGSGETLSPAERAALRYHANPNHTGNRAGVLPLFEGMPIEVAEKVCASANVLKATRGVIEHIILHEDEPRDYQLDGSAARQRGFHSLHYSANPPLSRKGAPVGRGHLRAAVAQGRRARTVSARASLP